MKVVFMGTPHAAVPTLEKLITDGHEIAAVYSQPDKPSGRGQKMSVSAVRKFAAARGLDVRQPVKIKTDEASAEFRWFKADVAIVVAYGRILPESFLKAFPHGAINVHFSLLPKYRGAAPVNWAIVNGENETGVTTMRMDAGLDTGDILMQETTMIGADETSVQLMSRLADIGAELLSRTLSDLDSIEPRSQGEDQASYAPIMRREDGLIDWSMPAKDIANRVRGFQPFPTAFTTLGEQKLTVWKATAVAGSGRLGEIVEVSRDAITVACGADSHLRVKELQLEGKRRMSAGDFVNGTKLAAGERLGG